MTDRPAEYTYEHDGLGETETPIQPIVSRLLRAVLHTFTLALLCFFGLVFYLGG